MKHLSLWESFVGFLINLNVLAIMGN